MGDSVPKHVHVRDDPAHCPVLVVYVNCEGRTQHPRPERCAVSLRHETSPESQVQFGHDCIRRNEHLARRQSGLCILYCLQRPYVKHPVFVVVPRTETSFFRPQTKLPGHRIPHQYFCVCNQNHECTGYLGIPLVQIKWVYSVHVCRYDIAMESLCGELDDDPRSGCRVQIHGLSCSLRAPEPSLPLAHGRGLVLCREAITSQCVGPTVRWGEKRQRKPGVRFGTTMIVPSGSRCTRTDTP